MTNDTHIQLWDKCLRIIGDILPEEQYNAWFKDITSYSYENNTLVLCVASSYIAEHIEEHYIKVLSPVLQRVYGQKVNLYYRYNQVKDIPDTSRVEKSENPSAQINDSLRQGDVASPFQPVSNTDIDPQLNPRYTFENYCYGESNKIVRSIAEAIANDPTNHTFNPLFIFGPVGVGKTHLIQAIGIRIKEKNPRSRVLYVTARLFEAQYTTAVAKKDTNRFFRFYQSIDTLIVDDIQDLHDKPGTQNIFYHIFNHLHQNNKQIIMSSDRAPVDMEGFEDRLLSRFKWGMSAELSRPDIDLRRRVLQQKAQVNGVSLPDDVREYIAANVTTSIRDLEGIMVSMLAHATALNCDLTLDLARRVVGNNVKVSTKPINFDYLAQEVCTYYNLDKDALFTKSRKREVSDARQVLMYLAKKMARLPIVDIGRLLSRTHATVVYACNTIEERLCCDTQLQADILTIESAFA